MVVNASGGVLSDQLLLSSIRRIYDPNVIATATERANINSTPSFGYVCGVILLLGL
jgi:hypothetical protein